MNILYQEQKEHYFLKNAAEISNDFKLCMQKITVKTHCDKS